MPYIKEIISHSLNLKQYFETENICFFDIETTGLNRNKNMIYLIGILYFDISVNNWILKQYFADSFHREIDILNKFIYKISSFDTIITYNGNSFDIPFIEHRLKHHKINYTIDRDKSFDLYQLIRTNRAYLPLENLKLKTVEKYLGINREDIYSGYDCIKFYYDYIKSNNQNLKDNILKHNYDDLIYMLDVISIIEVLDDKKSFYLDFQGSNIKFTIQDIEISGDLLSIEGKLDTRLKNNIKHFGNNLQLTTKDFNKFYLTIEFKRGYVSNNQIGSYLDLSNYPSLNLIDSNDYSLPSNIFLLLVDKKYCTENLKNLVKKVFKQYD